MKKIYSLIVGKSLMTATQAQVTLGVRGGVNLSTVSSESSENKKTFKFGETAGVYATIKLVDNLSIQPEL